MDNLMRSGEFARMCRTTKETLRHYDAIGLLKPAAVEDNGYKRYSLLQLTDFTLIATLRDAGCPLAEIRSYLAAPDRDGLAALLGEKASDIARQRALLLQKQRMLENTLAKIETLSSWSADEAAGRRWRIAECPERHYIETPAPLDDEDVSALLAAVDDHMGYCEAAGFGWGTEVQQSYRIEGRRFAAGEYGAGFSLCTPIPHAADLGRLHVRPAGRYFQYLNGIPLGKFLGQGAGDLENPLFSAYDQVRELMDGLGLRQVGDAYDAELSLYSGAAGENLYTEISVQVA